MQTTELNSSGGGKGPIIVRTVVSAFIAILLLFSLFYPSWHWLQLIVGIVSVVGIHLVPSVNQGRQ